MSRRKQDLQGVKMKHVEMKQVRLTRRRTPSLKLWVLESPNPAFDLSMRPAHSSSRGAKLEPQFLRHKFRRAQIEIERAQWRVAGDVFELVVDIET